MWSISPEISSSTPIWVSELAMPTTELEPWIRPMDWFFAPRPPKSGSAKRYPPEAKDQVPSACCVMWKNSRWMPVATS